MAWLNTENTNIPLPKNNIILSPNLKPLYEAFLLGTFCSTTIQSSLAKFGITWRDDQIESLRLLVREMQAKDPPKALQAMQFVLSHLLGLKLLSYHYPDDQKLGLRLLKLGNRALEKLN